MRPLSFLLGIGMHLLSLVAYTQSSAPRIVINPMGHSAKIQNLLFTPDGQKLISISEDKTVRLWNTQSGEMLKKLESQIGDGPEGMLYASALSPDGKLLAISGFTVTDDNRVYIAIIDLQLGVQVAVATGHTSIVNSLAFTSNSKYLISGSDDGTIKVWTTGASPYSVAATITIGAPVKYFTLNAVTMDLAVAIQGKNTIQVYPLSNLEKGMIKFTPKIWSKHKSEINKLVYSPDGQYLASSSSSNEFYIWRNDGELLKEINGSSMINAMAFSHDSKILVGLDVKGRGASYGVPGGGKFTDFSAHDNTVFTAVFIPVDNGQYVVASAGGNAHEIYLWNPINGKVVSKMKGLGTPLQQIVFGAGLELFISQPGAIKKNDFSRSFDFNIMKVNTSMLNTPTSKPDENGISQPSEFVLNLSKGKHVQNNPEVDGRILDFKSDKEGNIVVASDFSLKMYDRSGFLKKEFLGHTGGIRTVSFSADARYLASGSEDQTIILWKLDETGAAPSLREAFPDKEWADFFTSLPIDSLTHDKTKKAWLQVIDFLKANNIKAYKGVEDVYRNLGETLLPFATLFLAEDNEWVCWTHKGYFSCTSSGSKYFGWHVNRGINKLADFYAADQYFDILYRPEEMTKSINQGIRVEEILRKEGKRIFDLSKLHRPSAVLFSLAKLSDNNLIKLKSGVAITEQTSLPIDIDIYDGGGGIKEVNIYQNDKLIVSDHDFKISGEGDHIKRTYKVDLVNEENLFKAVVINYQKIESHPDFFSVNHVGEIMTTSALHVMVVGINKYQNAAYNLNYAKPDAMAFIQALSAQSQRIFKSINKVELYDTDATKANIVKGLKSIADAAKPEDVFVFFYAGHGSLDEEHKDADGDSPFYFVPTDVTKMYGTQQLVDLGLSGNEMRDYLTHIKSTKQIVLTDACHSGGALKSMNVRAVAGDEKAIMQLARSSGVIWIASSGSKQFATEFEVLKHGVFTYALLEAFEGKADNGDNKLTANELKFYMEERVPELTKKYGGQSQYPTGYIHGNDFPISVTK